MVLVKHGRTQKYKRQWHHRRHLMPRPLSSHGNWSVPLTTERRNKRTIDNYDVTKRARLTTSDSPRNTRVTPRERNREIHTHLIMNTVEYLYIFCYENFATEQSYLNHKAQNHLGQRWKCHICERFFVRRLERSLHIAEGHPHEPRSTPEKSDFIGGLRPPRKTCQHKDNCA